MSQAVIAPGLSGISETMLWSLHNRACEARRHDRILDDPRTISIHDAISYDFHASFGTPSGSLAARAARIDEALRQWLVKTPDGLVVSLGEGLETQASRVDNGRMRWLSVDLPHAISLRERFIAPTSRFTHLAASALLPGWMDHVDASAGLCVIAQGLLMYFQPDLVEQLFCSIAARFPGAMMVFDTVPSWFSRLTLKGHQQTPHYRLPPMPWGIDQNRIEETLKTWHPGVRDVEFLAYRAPRGMHRYISGVVHAMPVFRHQVPCLLRVGL
jgi:O-methyltransferase involved in polyketide biosynthesis